MTAGEVAALLASSAGAGVMNALAGGSQLIVGRQVQVQWADGNRYPGTLLQNNGAQAQVVMSDGQTLWLDPKYLTPA